MVKLVDRVGEIDVEAQEAEVDDHERFQPDGRVAIPLYLGLAWTLRISSACALSSTVCWRIG